MTRTSLLDASQPRAGRGRRHARRRVDRDLQPAPVRRRRRRRAPAGPPHARPVPGHVGASRRMARRRRGAGCRGIPHPRRDDRASPRATSSSSTPSATSTAPPPGSSPSCTGRCCGPTRSPAPPARRERRVVRRGIPPPPRLRPQRDRRLRALAAAQQGGLQPHRARPARRRVHPRRAARGVRVDPRPAPGPRELPPPGGELRAPSSRPSTSARAATGRPASTATTRTSSSPTAGP